jgi:hypothetical protein
VPLHTATQTHKNMRTKALLCAAALAASAASTMAQGNVYSLNIVGYVNVSFAPGNSIHANPLDLGDGQNSASNLFSSLPDGTFVNLWTGSSFDVYYFDSTLGIDPRNWYGADTVTGRSAPNLPPGRGFFLNNPGASFTNIFVGSVFPGPGTTNTATLAPGNSLVASRLPISGSVTNAPWNFPTLDGMFVNKWTGSAYDVYYFDSTLGIDPRNWYGADTVTGRNAPSFNVGEGFFLNNPAAASPWAQSLP